MVTVLHKTQTHTLPSPLSPSCLWIKCNSLLLLQSLVWLPADLFPFIIAMDSPSGTVSKNKLSSLSCSSSWHFNIATESRMTTQPEIGEALRKPTEHRDLGVCDHKNMTPVNKNLAEQWVFHTELLLRGSVFDPSFRLPLGLWVKSPSWTSTSRVSRFQLSLHSEAEPPTTSRQE